MNELFFCKYFVNILFSKPVIYNKKIEVFIIYIV